MDIFKHMSLQAKFILGIDAWGSASDSYDLLNQDSYSGGKVKVNSLNFMITFSFIIIMYF